MDAARAAVLFEEGDIASDDKLVAGCANGDPQALGELFDRHHLAVYRFLGRLCRGGSRDVDDLVQATFLEVQRAARGFRGGSAVKTWILGIAANVARHYVRSESRERALLSELGKQVELAGIGARRPDETAEQSEMLERLADALAELPQDLRVVFVACELEDLPGAEVARSLGVREGTLWRRLHDARKALAVVLDRRS
jgi:RNA polymerase sigma-70 factor (ECF subfamily)